MVLVAAAAMTEAGDLNELMTDTAAALAQVLSAPGWGRGDPAAWI